MRRRDKHAFSGIQLFQRFCILCTANCRAIGYWRVGYTNDQAHAKVLSMAVGGTEPLKFMEMGNKAIITIQVIYFTFGMESCSLLNGE